MNLYAPFAALCGVALVILALASAVRSFVLPRSAQDFVMRVVFQAMQVLFRVRLHKTESYADRDQIMAFYAPISVLVLEPVWLLLVLCGYALIYSALGLSPYDAVRLSGSSLLTLGITAREGWVMTALIFSEATIGLLLVALLMAYLPTMYSAFQKREARVTLLEVRAGSPPSAIEMISRFSRLDRLHRLVDEWAQWEVWFVEIEESHTSLAPLNFFRSPQHDRSWITAAGTVLDAAALMLAAVEGPAVPEAALCVRAGYIALRRISDFFTIDYDPEPKPDDPISISRDEFEQALDQLAANNVPLKPDRDQAWRDFHGWRVNYDVPLLALAALTKAPYAMWSSDRSLAIPVPFKPKWYKR